MCRRFCIAKPRPLGVRSGSLSSTGSSIGFSFGKNEPGDFPEMKSMADEATDMLQQCVDTI